MYDTVSRAFITLGQVLGMIGQGIKLRVIDKASGLDITNLTRIRAIANEVEALAQRMSGFADGDARKLNEMAKELGRLTMEMAGLRRLIKKEARDGSQVAGS